MGAALGIRLAVLGCCCIEAWPVRPRCGDSALWTGAYLAAESFRYTVTRSDALANVKAALAVSKRVRM